MKRFTLTLSAILVAFALSALLHSSKVSSQSLPNGKAPQSRLGIYGVMGFIISQVDPGSTAEQAGLRPGDIVTNVNGQVTDIQEFQNVIGTSAPGTTLNIEYLRFNPATRKAEEHKASVKTMPFRSLSRYSESSLPITKASQFSSNTKPASELDCPYGCCWACLGFSPNKYCVIVDYFTG